MTDNVFALWQDVPLGAKLCGMKTGSVGAVLEFGHAGRRYRWREGALHPAAARFRGRRRELMAVFHGAVLPSLARRGAAREERAAGEAGVWVAWRAAGEAPVWALYVFTRALPGRALADLGRPANDGAVLAAWGDGPVLAWASEREALRHALREALRALPDFLAEGVCSADETFAVQVTASPRATG